MCLGSIGKCRLVEDSVFCNACALLPKSFKLCALGAFHNFCQIFWQLCVFASFGKSDFYFMKTVFWLECAKVPKLVNVTRLGKKVFYGL